MADVENTDEPSIEVGVGAEMTIEDDGGGRDRLTQSVENTGPTDDDRDPIHGRGLEVVSNHDMHHMPHIEIDGGMIGLFRGTAAGTDKTPEVMIDTVDSLVHTH